MKLSKALRQLHPYHYIGAVVVFCLLCTLYTSTLNALFQQGNAIQWKSIWQDTYLRRTLFFSLWQAFLSTILSIFFAFFIARACFYQQFKGKKLLLRLFSLTFVLPALVAIFGIIGVYGASGWLAKLSSLLGFNWRPNIYGLTGILIAHLFFNIPLACRIILQTLQAIPSQQHLLAAQLNLRGWQFIRLIELPALRQPFFSLFSLIFMLCFTSFTIVLILGGSPKYATLEVAIYQAISFEFDLPKATLFALLQFLLCLFFFSLSNLFERQQNTQLSQQQRWQAPQSKLTIYWQYSVILCASLFILSPLLNTLWEALVSPKLLQAWQNPQLWRAIGYSFLIAPSAAITSLLMAIAILLLARRLQWLQQNQLANSLINIGTLILSIPTLVLALGLFLLLRDYQLNNGILFCIIVLFNALSAMPFILRVLATPMYQNLLFYEKLCQSLSIQGWQRLKLIEWQRLRPVLQYAFALACALSLGDFTAIALFGNQNFTSLPYLLYQQLGSYRIAEASVTALILLLCCVAIFLIVERHQHRENSND